MYEVECVLKWEAILGESPIWSVQESVLYWVDILSNVIYRFNPKTRENFSIQMDQSVTALGLTKTGDMILALADGVGIFSPKIRTLTMISRPELQLKDNRFNDGKCDRQGRFWCGTMNKVDMKLPTGNLYRVDHDQVVCMQNGVVLSNGIDWSPDNKIMYHAETLRYTIFAYDFSSATGEIKNQRVFVKIDPLSGGVPDGLTVDSEGFIWNVHNGTGKVIRYSPTGEIDQIIDLPVPRPTSCVFGGDAFDVLYITTSRENMTTEELNKFPLSGSLLAIKSTVKGLEGGYYLPSTTPIG